MVIVMGRPEKILDKELIEDIIKEEEGFLTTNEIKKRYNDIKDESISHPVLKKNLDRFELFEGKKVVNSTVWIVSGDN